MNLSMSKQTVWAATLKDEPGSLAGKLATLSDAGVNLDFVIARRSDRKKGEGVVFVTPIKGSKQIAAAKKAGFQKTESLHALRVEGADKPGLGAEMTRLIAEAEINLRGLSAAAIGNRCVVNLAFDTDEDARKARRVLNKL